MWVEAFDLILQKLSNANFDFAKVIAVSGSGQQHGSVYWSKGSSEVLRSLDSKRSLKEQLENAFSVKESPIWMDSSTTLQCKEIENAINRLPNMEFIYPDITRIKQLRREFSLKSQHKNEQLQRLLEEMESLGLTYDEVMKFMKQQTNKIKKL